jgi:hypothetical protein
MRDGLADHSAEMLGPEVGQVNESGEVRLRYEGSVGDHLQDPLLAFPHLAVPLQHITLGDDAFELAEIGAAHHRHKRPAIYVTQSSL